MESSVDNALIVKKTVNPGNRQAAFKDGAKVKKSRVDSTAPFISMIFYRRYHFTF